MSGDEKTAAAELARLREVSSVTYALAGSIANGLYAAEESGEAPNYHELTAYAAAICLLHDDPPEVTL